MTQIEELDNFIQNSFSKMNVNKYFYKIMDDYYFKYLKDIYPANNFTTVNIIKITLDILNDLKNKDLNLSYKDIFILISLLNKFLTIKDYYNDYEFNKFILFSKDDIRYLICNFNCNVNRFYIYNLLDDNDDIIYICTNNIKYFNTNKKTIREFNIPRLKFKSNFENHFKCKFKNLLNLMYKNILYLYLHKMCFTEYYHINISNTNMYKIFDILHSLNNRTLSALYTSSNELFLCYPENSNSYYIDYEDNKKELNINDTINVYLDFLKFEQ